MPGRVRALSARLYAVGRRDSVGRVAGAAGVLGELSGASRHFWFHLSRCHHHRLFSDQVLARSVRAEESVRPRHLRRSARQGDSRQSEGRAFSAGAGLVGGPLRSEARRAKVSEAPRLPQAAGPSHRVHFRHGLDDRDGRRAARRRRRCRRSDSARRAESHDRRRLPPLRLGRREGAAYSSFGVVDRLHGELRHLDELGRQVRAVAAVDARTARRRIGEHRRFFF